MAQPIFCPPASQVESFLRQFAQAPGLPFGEVLDERLVQQAIERSGVAYRDSIFTPAVTLALFVGQAVDPDPSLRQAVARLLAQRQLQGLPACSSDTGAYAKARQRLPEPVLADLARSVGRDVLEAAPPQWRWRGREVKVVDGSTLSMPDTPANQAAYPQPASQKPGVGFPLMRFVALFSLSAGTVLDAAWGPCQGKETGETALFRILHHNLERGDILLADRYFCSYFEVALLQQQGVDIVMRLHQRRSPDLRRCRRLGPGEGYVTWFKPARPAWLSVELYEQLPNLLILRLIRIRVPGRNTRSRRIDVVTTLRNARVCPRRAVADLYRQRWHGELDLRSLKCVMHMDVLRGQTPEMVRKEIWAHLLAYNLIRKVMAQAAQTHDLQPRTISFKATLQTLDAFAPVLALSTPEELLAVIEQMLQAIAKHQVGDRPDRLEPRRRKRRPKPHPLLNEPRAQARKREIT